jgi:methyltransferase (TIGR00027 family)
MDDRPSRTAELVCLVRATDQARPKAERILDDPLAEHFLGPVSKAALSTLKASGRLGERAIELAPGLLTYVLCRHRFIDQHLVQALDEGVRQVVLLGAGYDTRPWRLARPGVEFYEVDHPATAMRKASLVESLEPAARHSVRVDFERDDLGQALRQAGLKPEPTFFVWEGVSMYLTRAAVKQTLATLQTLAPRIELAMDLWFLLDSQDRSATLHRSGAGLLHLLGEPDTFGLHPEDAPDFLRRCGLECLDLATPTTLEARYVHDERRVYPACYTVHARGG